MSEIKTIGIIGGGKMGTSIFNYLSQFSHNLVWIVRSNADKVEKKYHRKLQRALKNELISDETYAYFFQNHIITSDLERLNNCELVIESIVEDLYEKRNLIAQLFKIVNKDAIIASNSSSILPHRLVDKPAYQARVIGLHFFYPVEMKNIVELVVGNAVAKHLQDAKQQMKQIEALTNLFSERERFIFTQKEQNAFLLNRLMLHLQVAAYSLHVEQGYSFAEIDKAVDEYLFPIGIFAMMDHIGLDTLLYSIKNYTEIEKEPIEAQHLMSFIEGKVNCKEIGLKSKCGFYNYLESEEVLEFNQKEMKRIASQLAKMYFSAYNWYTENKYCSCGDLSLAMDEYLDTQTEPWKDLIDE